MTSPRVNRQNRRRIGAAVASVVVVVAVLVAALIFVNNDSGSDGGNGDTAANSGSTDSGDNSGSGDSADNSGSGDGDGGASLASYCAVSTIVRGRFPGDPEALLLQLQKTWTIRSERSDPATRAPEPVAEDTEIVQSALDKSVTSDTTAPLEAPETIAAANRIRDFQDDSCG